MGVQRSRSTPAPRGDGRHHFRRVAFGLTPVGSLPFKPVVERIDGRRAGNGNPKADKQTVDAPRTQWLLEPGEPASKASRGARRRARIPVVVLVTQPINSGRTSFGPDFAVTLKEGSVTEAGGAPSLCRVTRQGGHSGQTPRGLCARTGRRSGAVASHYLLLKIGSTRSPTRRRTGRHRTGSREPLGGGAAIGNCVTGVGGLGHGAT